MSRIDLPDNCEKAWRKVEPTPTQPNETMHTENPVVGRLLDRHGDEMFVVRKHGTVTPGFNRDPYVGTTRREVKP